MILWAGTRKGYYVIGVFRVFLPIPYQDCKVKACMGQLSRILHVVAIIGKG